MLGILSGVFGTRHDRERKRVQPIVDEINEYYSRLQGVSEEELRAATREVLEELLPEAFATVLEASRRLLGTKVLVTGQEMDWNMVHYDVQLMGGIQLHSGRIAEMATGE